MPKRRRGQGFTAMGAARCAILCRVSTEAQHLDVQRSALLAEAQRRGFAVVEVVEDVGSGRKMEERAGLRRVLELADARAIDVLLVAELSRLGRSIRGLAEAIDRLSARGVSLISLRGDLDVSSATGRFLVHILAAVAQFEAELLGERTSAGLDAAKARGRAVGQAPYGARWRLGSDDAPAALEPVESELETLRRALALRTALGTWDAATAALNAEGRFGRRGKPWHRQTLASAAGNARVRPFLATGERGVAVA